MFIEFKFGNFRSFRDLQKFSLEAAVLRTNDNGLEEENVFQKSSLRLLKSKAVFGGNASGKSNLAKAISAFTHMVDRSVAQEGLPGEIWENRFKLITEWDEQPMFFQYLFLFNESIFRYGFQIAGNIISYEWLYSGSEEQEIEYFMRSPDGLKINEAQFSESFINQARGIDSELFRVDSLFLTAAALNGNKLLAGLRNLIRSIFSVDGVADKAAAKYGMSVLVDGDNDQKKALQELLQAADTGVEDLEVGEYSDHLPNEQSLKETEETAEGSKSKSVSLFSSHSRYDDDGNFVDKIKVPFGKWESEGTRKLFGIGSLILDVLRYGRVMVIDEFDARFHPNLTLKIVQMFHNEETNPNHAQLIFLTHDASLLRRAKLRRDQICLISKDSYGISSMSNLIEFKGVRKDASYEKEYLNGTYSGIPYLDKMNWVVTKNSIQNGI